MPDPSINWDHVAENILGGAVVAFFFGIFLNWLINWRNRAQLQLIINLEEPPTGTNFDWISVEVANLGSQGFEANDIVWHIYWPHIFSGGYFIDKKGIRLSVEDRSFEKVGESNIHGQRHSHFQRSVDIGVASGREVCILYFHLPRKFSSGEIKVPYQFSTRSKGVVPRRVWKGVWWNKIDDKDNFPNLEFLPLAKVRDIRNSKHKGTSFIPSEEMTNEWF